MSERIAIFVDAGNIFYAQRSNGWQIDFKKVRQYFSHNREIYGAFYVTAAPPLGNTDEVKKYRSFRGYLIHNNWTVIDKEVKVIIDKTTGEKILKGNLDVELVFKMLTTVNGWDTAYLFGGDGDLVKVLEHIANLGKKVIVIAKRQSTATELINVAHQFIDLNEIRDQIERVKEKK